MTNKEELLSSFDADKLVAELKELIQKGRTPSKDAVTINRIIAGLGDPRGLVRRTFSEALGMIGNPATPALRGALIHHKSVTTRRAAAKTLKLVGDPSALPDLLQALINDKDPVVQCSSAGAMAIFGKEAFELLQTVLIDPKSSSMQKGLASWGIAFIGAEAPDQLKNAAQSKHAAVRAAAIAALGDQIQSLDDEEAKHLLIDALSDKSSDVRAEASTLLGKLDNAELAKEKLEEKLNDESSQVRKNSALSLMRLKSTGSLQYLQSRRNVEEDKKVLKVLKFVIKYLSN